MKCYYCESKLENHSNYGLETCIDVIGMNITKSIVDDPECCRHCGKLKKEHQRKDWLYCATQINDLARKQKDLPFDDVDSQRHRNEIVEACINDNNLGN